jgi:hypothetical protein
MLNRNGSTSTRHMPQKITSTDYISVRLVTTSMLPLTNTEYNLVIKTMQLSSNTIEDGLDILQVFLICSFWKHNLSNHLLASTEHIMHPGKEVLASKASTEISNNLIQLISIRSLIV